MSVREEDRKKNSCPSRGLGLAAAAVGIGVGAALYYFFNKRSENPDAEGSTSGEWTCERDQTLNESTTASEFTTISEYTTSDTSMYDTESSTSYQSTNEPNSSYAETDLSTDSSYYADESIQETSYNLSDFENTSSRRESIDSDTAMNWDVTDSSSFVESVDSPQRSWFDILRSGTARTNRNRVNRQRSWSLEECSICFEIMLKDQELASLPCSHNFHVACIGPWLQEHQTCPNCRKPSE